VHKESIAASFLFVQEKENSLFNLRSRPSIKAKVGGQVNVRLLVADFLADPGKLLLPDALNLLFADVLCLRTNTKPTKDLVLPGTLRKDRAVIRLHASGTFDAPTRE